MRIVIAVGGNALAPADPSPGPEGRRAAARVAAEPIARLVAAGHQVLLTHGNGPQVGDLLLKNELAASQRRPDPLDWCGAQTQATIGTLLMNALDPALVAAGSDARTVVLVSRTLVDAADPHFADPSKPIGRYLSEAEMRPLREHGQHFVEVPHQGWRRVVASPEPVECVDAEAADALLAAGFVVVCSGGGGIPTVRDTDGTLRGVEAVIDKDLTAALVAEHINADILVIATDVEHVATWWDTPSAAPVGEVSAAEMRAIADRERFAAGSMGPKVEAVIRFAETGLGAGVITSLEHIGDAVDGDVGTRVLPS